MLNQAIIIDKKNYFIIKQALAKDVCELLSDYANFKAQLKPNIHKNQDPLHGIHREYGDLMMETLLQKFTPLIEQATGLELWPTLSFYYKYKNGDQLIAHKDRSSCQFVAGLCIGSDDMFENREPKWPLVLKIGENLETIALDCGDMVIFEGHQIEHWRELFTGQWFVSAIFGYVDKNGPYAFQKFDQRKSLGKAHVGMFHWVFGCFKHKIQLFFKTKGLSRR